MTKIHKSIALSLMATYQQHVAMAGNVHSQLSIGRHQVDLCIFADSLTEIHQYGEVLLNLGVSAEDINYDFFGHQDTAKDFHLITITFNID